VRWIAPYHDVIQTPHSRLATAHPYFLASTYQSVPSERSASTWRSVSGRADMPTYSRQRFLAANPMEAEHCNDPSDSAERHRLDRPPYDAKVNRRPRSENQSRSSYRSQPAANSSGRMRSTGPAPESNSRSLRHDAYLRHYSAPAHRQGPSRNKRSGAVTFPIGCLPVPFSNGQPSSPFRQCSGRRGRRHQFFHSAALKPLCS